jgi:hypothetical protein
MQQVRARARLGLLDQLVMVHTAPDAVVRGLIDDAHSAPANRSFEVPPLPENNQMAKSHASFQRRVLVPYVEFEVRGARPAFHQAAVVHRKVEGPGDGVLAAHDPAIEYRVRLPLAVNQHLWSACATPACRYDGSL